MNSTILIFSIKISKAMTIDTNEHTYEHIFYFKLVHKSVKTNMIH